MTTGNLKTDVAILTDLYHSTGGDKWKRQRGWLRDDDLSKWDGLTIKDDRVVCLDLPDNNMSGE